MTWSPAARRAQARTQQRPRRGRRWLGAGARATPVVVALATTAAVAVAALLLFSHHKAPSPSPSSSPPPAGALTPSPHLRREMSYIALAGRQVAGLKMCQLRAPTGPRLIPGAPSQKLLSILGVPGGRPPAPRSRRAVPERRQRRLFRLRAAGRGPPRHLVLHRGRARRSGRPGPRLRLPGSGEDRIAPPPAQHSGRVACTDPEAGVRDRRLLPQDSRQWPAGHGLRGHPFAQLRR